MGLFDEKKEPVIFHLGVDEQASYYLLQTIKWKKFMAIIGIVLTAILLIVAIVSLFGMAALGSASESVEYAVGTAVGYGIGILLLSLLYIYPIVCLLRFCSNMRMALSGADTILFNRALMYQRNLWRFMGILMIVILVFYGIVFLFGVSRFI